MTPGVPTGYEHLTPAQAADVDGACDRFEAAWRAGQSPHPEDFLTEVDEPARPALLRELLLIEVAYRRRLGESCDTASYAARFPDLDPTWLDAALGATPPVPAGGPARYQQWRFHARGGL